MTKPLTDILFVLVLTINNIDQAASCYNSWPVKKQDLYASNTSSAPCTIY